MWIVMFVVSWLPRSQGCRHYVLVRGKKVTKPPFCFLANGWKKRPRDVKNVTHYITSLPSAKRHSWIWSEVSINRRPQFPMSKFRPVWNAKNCERRCGNGNKMDELWQMFRWLTLLLLCVLQVWRCFAEDPSHRGLWTLLKFIFFSSSNGHLITTFDFNLFPTGRLAFSFHSPTPWCLSVDFKSWIFIKFSNKCHQILLEGTLWRTCEAGDLYRWK